MPKMERIEDGRKHGHVLRVWRRKGKKISERSEVLPSLRIKCGCCDNAIVIYHDEGQVTDQHLNTLEINGVMATVDQWKKVLLPLLGMADK